MLVLLPDMGQEGGGVFSVSPHTPTINGNSGVAGEGGGAEGAFVPLFTRVDQINCVI